ncbi:hypothetical protein Halha_0930 [Halobacteroides halobius DSM 5150]|uniref:DUF58 domain-containing protein n=1 Tax=Halobacteroides halobius (strain ATCC 35273 / DSM 5150 / MD-1) TaxID=748449 RepID=L0K7B2_HALHC|nr:DUF58 domain-containing protein [Halobacteroides halobius]AGB40891.1 hypothetical protein Halha_0930 [Halobacteroides halobius DSM 5150]
MKYFLIFAIIVILLAPVSGVYELYYLAYISLALPLVLVFLIKQGVKNLKVERVVNKDRIFATESSKVKLNLINQGIWPIFWLSYKERVPIQLHPPLKGEVISLGSFAEYGLEYTLQGRQRGMYDLGPVRVKLGDGLGFIETELKFDAKEKLIVYPNILPLDDLGLPSRIAFGDLIWPQRIYRDPTSFRGLREYQLGDQLKDVYWTASASTGELMVKEYESTVTLKNLILLNLNQDDYGVKRLKLQVESAIEVAASLAKYLIEVNQTVGLATNGCDPLAKREFIKPGQGSGHLMEIMELLARVEPTEDKSFLPFISQYSHQVSPGSTLLIITKVDSEELIKTALQLCKQGLNIVLIVLGREVFHPQYLNKSYTESLVIYQLNRKEDIYAWGR